MDSRHIRHGTCEPNLPAHFPSLVRGMLASLAAGVALVAPAFAQDGEPCPGNNPARVPTAVAVTDVPIVVPSTTDDYFVLYVSHEMDADTTVELPVLVKRGTAGTTTLAENVEALPAARYRVEKYLSAEPADVDGDCTDDLTELDNLGSMNPINPAAVDISDGMVALSNRAAWEAIAIRNDYLKFILADMDTDRPSVYFLDYETHLGHDSLLRALEVERDQPGLFTGNILWRSKIFSGDSANKQGTYYFNLTSYDSSDYTFAAAARTHSVLAASMSFIENNLAFHISNQRLWHYQDELPLFRESRIDLVFDEDIRTKKKFIALNETVGFGLLRVMDPEERPSPRDVVVYESLPNELPRVAGIISTVPQTPLSHVNLRALQDGVPNAYVRDARTHPTILDLIGKYVRYEVTDSEWKMRAATLAEVDAHYVSSRPTAVQSPERDLLVTSITALGDIGFDDWDAFGVKAANVAVLGGLRLPEGTVPDGFAIPFYFYDEFMKHNGFYDDIVNMLADEDFQSDFDTQVSQLKSLRKEIEDAETPQWIINALVEMNKSFEDGVHRRYRSSTNNEDLPSFNGAGLYDSKSQKPSEDEEDLAKSLKEVYASLWNFRAFAERDFHRVDHLTTAMGVLVHPSYRDEKVNGVAVSFAVVSGNTDYYYVNSQIDEDLVTNPEALSIPEEILLRPHGRHVMIRTSNQVEPGELLLTTDQMALLRSHLSAIHNKFEELYGPADGEPFAMEIEFKITADDVLAIKQARPWVFGDVEPDVPPPPDPPAVSVSKNRSEVTEGRDAEFTLRRTVSSRALTVEVRVSENGAMVAAANEGTQTVAFTAGAATVPLVVATEDDSVAEANSVVRVQVEAGAGYTVASTDDSASVTVTDNDAPPPPDPPVVSVSKNRSEVTEGRDAEFTLRRTVSSRALTVEVRVSENGAMVAAANEGTQTVAFTAGAATVPLVVATEDDSVAEANSVVRVQVEAGTGYMVASTDDSASVTVTDNDAPPPPPPPPDPPPPDPTPLGSGGGGGVGGGSTGSRDVHSNSPAGATVITPTSTTTGTIAPAGDVDYFTFPAPQAGVLIVETSGSTATVGTVWQDGAELAMADSGGAGQNLRLSVRVAAGPVVVAVAGHGRQTGAYTLQTTLVVGYLENPGADSFQSGIGVLSGWVCEAEAVEIELNGTPQDAAYGTERVDTQGVCGDTDNGFGLLFNWNLLGDGEHDVVAAVDGVELGRATITVTTLGAEFVRGAAGECEVADFPSPGEAVTLVWQQANQKFVIAGERAPTGDNAARSGTLVGYLENPGADSFQSGIGVISGWVCEAGRVEIEVETENGEVVRQGAAYGTERLDTEGACGDTDNGFGLLFNWNLLDDGVHTVVAVVDGVELGRATVRVTTLGEEFVRGAVGECVVEDFPMLGETVTLEWQQNSQNFVIANVE